MLRGGGGEGKWDNKLKLYTRIEFSHSVTEQLPELVDRFFFSPKTV